MNSYFISLKYITNGKKKLNYFRDRNDFTIQGQNQSIKIFASTIESD